MSRGRGRRSNASAPRRRIGRRRKNVQRTTNFNRSLQPLPSRYICKMKYSDVLTTNLTGQYVMNLNSVFDPDRTGFGHQPYAFDNLSALYNRYRVISCGWRISVPITTAGNAIQLGCMPSNDLSITFANLGEMIENPRVRYITQNPGASIQYLSGKQNLPALMGRTTAQYMADDKYEAIVTASPTENGLLYIQAFNAAGGQVPGLTFSVILEYTVEWFDIKHVVQS